MSRRYLAQTVSALADRIQVIDTQEPMAQVPPLMFDTPFESAIYLVMFNRGNRYVAEAGESESHIVVRDLDSGAVVLTFEEHPVLRDLRARQLTVIAHAAQEST